MKVTYLFTILLVLSYLRVEAQETIDAGNPNSYLLGGDQYCTPARVDLLPVSIIDIEPESQDSKLDPAWVGLEAGLPVSVNNSSMEYWLNYTSRGGKKRNRIYVRSSHPVPNRIVITVSITNYSNSSGDFIPNSIGKTVSLTSNNKVLVNFFENGFTGNGEGSGYQLKVEVNNPNLINLPAGFEIIYEIQ